MKRSQIFLVVGAVLLLVILFFVLLFQPSRDRVEELETQIAAEETQQAQLRTEIARLRDARAEAPELEAELAAAEAIVPRDAALPSAVRQLQLAANDAGMLLNSISTARPTDVPVGPQGLSAIDVSLQLEGGYFQLVDFLRRVEDPLLVPRGLMWNSVNVSPSEYPQLSVALSGRFYAVIVGPQPPPGPEPEPGEDLPEGEDGSDVEVDVDVDIDVEDES